MQLKSMAVAIGLGLLGTTGSLGVASAATYNFAGSWEVDQGPLFTDNAPNGPTAYTGLEAAALLFGGSASDYVISTAGFSAAQINNDAWYSIIGYGPAQEAQDYNNKYQGQYYGPTFGFNPGDPNAAASAYVNDTAIGATYTNYAFRKSTSAAPEPASWMLMIAGVAGAGVALRQSRRQGLAA